MIATKMCCEENMQTESISEEERTGISKRKSFDQNMSRKSSLNSREDIIEYCKSIINTQFYGEVDKKKLTQKRTRKSSLFTVLHGERMRKFTEEEMIIQIKKPSLTLGHLLRDLYNILQTTNKLTSNAIDSLDCLSEIRKQPGEDKIECLEKLKKQWTIFIELKQKAAQSINHVEVTESHWGSRIQMRAGKVISDHVTCQMLDPIYGVLLYPSAGQATIQDAYMNQSNTANEFRYFNNCDITNQPGTYHRIMQDSFRYLREAHDIGPGENYMDDYALFHSEHVSGNLLALIFWERLINRIIEEDIEIEVKTI